jgi:Na+/H+ antiporter NhaA
VTVWGTQLSVRVGDYGVSQDLRRWVNNGLMTLFFFVVGLEARREFDMGELPDRRRIALPLAAGIGGMLYRSRSSAARTPDVSPPRTVCSGLRWQP